MKKSILAIVLIAIFALVIIVFSSDNTDYKKLKRALKTSTLLVNPDKALVNFSLLDHNGDIFDNARLKNQWTLLFFGYTHCPDVCPTGLMDMNQLKKILKQRGLPSPEVVFVTFDTQRDSAEVLKSYVTFFNKDFIGVTGKQAQIDNFIKPFGAYYERVIEVEGKQKILTKTDKIPAGINTYLINHTAWIYLLSPDGQIFAGFPAPHRVEKMADDIKLLTQA